MEGKAVLRPVGKMVGLVQGCHPDHQPDEDGGVDDQPDDRGGHHLGVTLLPAVLPCATVEVFCQDDHVASRVCSRLAKFFIEAAVGEVATEEEEYDWNPDPKVDGRELFEEGADDGDGANLEDQACQECRGELDYQLKFLKKTLVLQH